MSDKPRRVCILLNSLNYGDAVSNHCMLLKARCRELGIPAEIYAESFHERVEGQGLPVSRMLAEAGTRDVLLHQFFNDTPLVPFVEQFPGWRVMTYHNITPPEYFPEGSPTHESCRRGLQLARSLPPLYDLAVGDSEVNRRELEQMGYAPTGVFPLLIDFDALIDRSLTVAARNRSADALPTFLFVGRVAPNKRFEDLLQFLAAYRAMGKRARLVIVGDDRQHPQYAGRLLHFARKLGLRDGSDFVFKGKISETALMDCYRGADAYLCMSEHEGFCAPLLESMAFDLPTFAYAAPACEETMGGAGVLFRNKDFPALARTVAEVLEDKSRLAEIVAAQRRRVQAFRPEIQRKALADLLEQIATLPSRAASFREPRVSIVINTYNRGPYLDRCLEALKKQTYPHFEVVVVNGPSTDDTEQRLEAHKDNIHIARTDSRVLCVSRNIGIRESRGQLIAFLDDDAIADPNWLRELVFAFADSSVGAIGGMVYRMGTRGIEFRNGIIDHKGTVKWDRTEPGLHWNWEEGWLNTVSGNCCIFRRSAIEKIGGFDEEIEYYHDEADVVMRLQMGGYRTLHRPRAVVFHEAAQSHNRTGPYQTNWFVVAKNTLYCALKNYAGPESRRALALKIVAQLASDRMRPIWKWWRQREITFRDFYRMEKQCLRGIQAGVSKGLNPAPKLAVLAPVEDDSNFLPYPVSAATRFSVCLLSQALPHTSPGGVGTYTLALARGLRDLGCSVHVVSRGERDTVELREGIWYHTTRSLPVSRALGLNGNYTAAARNLDYSRGVSSKVLDIAARSGLDVVEAPSWDAEGLVPAIENRLPVVVRLVSPMFKVMETQDWKATPDLDLCCEMEALAIKLAAGVIGSTNAILSCVLDRYNIQPARTAVIPFGLDLPRRAPQTETGAAKRVLFVGRLEARKGIHVLLEAIPRVIEACPGAIFDIVGKDVAPSYAGRWREEHPELRRCTVFHGELNDESLARLYEACDILAAPSIYESYGLIYVEAMARGKAVIGTNAGGIPEVVRDGETGLLVPPGDSAALADAIVYLLRDDACRNRLARAGFDNYARQFSQEAMARRTLDFYQTVLESRNASRSAVWSADAADLDRPSSTSIVWEPSAQCLCLMAERGKPHALAYGPYISLDAGDYRAEFSIWIEEEIGLERWVCTVDVFSARSGVFEELKLYGKDFPFGRGSNFDLPFVVPDWEEKAMEFRVHTSGAARLYLRRIAVVSEADRPLANADHRRNSNLGIAR